MLNKTWFSILMCIFLPPFGIYLLWKKNHFKEKTRIIITACSILFFISLLTTAPQDSTASNETKTYDEKFSQLEINTIDYANHIIKVTGKSDLPDGSKINVTFDLANRDGKETYIGNDVYAKIKNGQFKATIDVPKRPEFNNKLYVVEVLFTPKAQNDEIKKIIGENGETLTGENLRESSNFNVLESKKEIELDIEKFEFPNIDVKSYEENTPEKAVAQYINCWKNKTWDKMLNYTQLTWLDSKDNPTETLKNFYDFKDLLGSKIIEKNEVNSNMVTIKIKLYYGVGSDIDEKISKYNVIREDVPYSTSTSGKWGVNPTSTLREE